MSIRKTFEKSGLRTGYKISKLFYTGVTAICIGFVLIVTFEVEALAYLERKIEFRLDASSISKLSITILALLVQPLFQCSHHRPCRIPKIDRNDWWILGAQTKG